MTSHSQESPPGIGIVGNLNIDLLMGPLAHPPAFGHEMFVAERSIRAAGQAFYTVAALAALGQPPRLIGDVGDDTFGAYILDDLRASGIDVADVHIRAGMPTGLSVALLDERRDRAFVTHAGHLAALDAASIAARWSRFARARLLLYCGHCCLPGMRPTGGVEILRRARAEGIGTVLDTGWDTEDWTGSGRDEVRAMLQYTTVFIPNRDEAHALTGLADPAAAAAQLVDWGAGTVIVKLGPDGALALHGGDLVRVPAPAVAVADTVGAGDSFNAGALYALARDWPLVDILRLGIAVAGYAIGGRTPRYATITQARALMEAADQGVPRHDIRSGRRVRRR